MRQANRGLFVNRTESTHIEREPAMSESAPTPSNPQSPPPPSVLVRGFLPGLVLGVVVGVIVGIFSSELMRQPVIDVDENAVRSGDGASDRQLDREAEDAIDEAIDGASDQAEDMMEDGAESVPEIPPADNGMGDG